MTAKVPSPPGKMMKRAGLRARSRPLTLQEVRALPVATLARALRGASSTISPEWAADALARKRPGIEILGRAIRGRKPFRRAALYGFVWVKALKSRDLERIVEILEDQTEDAKVRGQAAEALAGHLRRDLRSRRAQQRHKRARAALVAALEDPEPEVRLWSIFALASPENADLLPRLEKLASDAALVAGYWTVGQEARWAMNRILKRNLDLDPSDL